MGIGKNKVKLIRSLGDKKNRDAEGLFVAEGEKIVGELLRSDLHTEILVATADWLTTNAHLASKVKEMYDVTDDELKKASSLSTPNKVLAVVRKKSAGIDNDKLYTELSLVLDDIQDPGNLGTILRIADWFGIRNIICSENTVDTYNPKVIQSSMGAFLRVATYHTSLDAFFRSFAKPDFNVYGALLDGKNIYSETLSSSGLIVMGNESKGISAGVKQFINRRIRIPGFPEGKQGAESLNVSVATGIICSEFRVRSSGRSPI